jgi:hypothetical protein
MSFPSTLTGAIDGVTEIEAAHLNNLEAKVGVDNSIDPNSLDYKLRNPSSSDPGHKHTAGAFTGGFDGDVFFRDPADHLWKPVGPDSANLVAKTGAQTIGGVKTFSSIPILPASDPIAANEATRKTYVDAQVALKVAKAGDTMSGNLAMGGNHVTGVGTLAAATAQLTNPLGVIYGGTGLAAVATGDMLYASAGNTLVALTKAAAGNVLLSGDAPNWGKVGLTAHVSGTLGAGNGGTGLAAYAVGDLLYASAANALSKLADVAVGNVLISGGVGVAPSWGKVGLTTHVDGVLPVANGGTGTATGSITGTGALVLAAGGANQNVTLTPSGTGATILNGNVGIGTTSFGASAVKVVGVGAGTAPSTAPADMAQMWVQDQAAGNACFHFLTELGKTIKLYQQAHLADPAADVTALAVWAANINLFLENLGLMASA